MLIALQSFRGARPRVDARELNPVEAQVARNVKLWSGKIRPWLRPKLEQVAVNPGPLKSIYRYTDAGYWLHWANDVDVARGPIAGTSRLYWTGDGAPRVGTLSGIAGVTALTAVAPGGQNYLLVEDATGFAVGQSISVTLDGGAKHTTTITTIQASLDRLNLANALPAGSSAAIGNSVVNNNKGYPHGSFLLGVPAPASAPTVAIDSDGNQGTVLGIGGVLGEKAGSTSTTADSYSIDLANIDSDGAMIDFEVVGAIAGQIASVQIGKIRLKVILDPATTNKSIYENVFDATYQGPQSQLADLAVLPAALSAAASWASAEQLAQMYARYQQALQAAASEAAAAPAPTNFHFQYAPSDGTHTYRLEISHEFSAADAAPDWSYSLRLTAKVQGRFGITLNTSDHNLKEGDKVQFAGIEGSGSLLDLNKAPANVTSVDGATVFVDADASGVYTSGGTWKQVWDEGDLETRGYVYTYVATLEGKDMEGPPSPLSALIDVGDGQKVNLSDLINPTSLADGRPYTSIRLYRTETDDQGNTDLYFAAQLALDAATHDDTLRDINLDEPLPSEGWDPPPDDMQGIVELPNQGMAAFRANELLLCVPDQPHAWPTTYRHVMQDQIVGLAAFGASILVCTQGRPTIATGVDPTAISEEHVEIVHPCLAKRGIVDMGYGILYPSRTGLVMVSQAQADVITGALFSDDDWVALNPSSFVASKYGNRYICFYDNGEEQAGFILDPRDASSTLTFLDLYATEIWSDPRTDELYLVIVNADGDEQIVKWDADVGSIPLRYRWRSKEFVNSVPESAALVKVDAELYPVRVNIYADGEVYDSVEIFDENAVRLVDGGLARKWEVEIEGDTEVEAVYVSSNTRELVRYVSGVA